MSCVPCLSAMSVVFFLSLSISNMVKKTQMIPVIAFRLLMLRNDNLVTQWTSENGDTKI